VGEDGPKPGRERQRLEPRGLYVVCLDIPIAYGRE
jgi:hypothetical protein